jgi:L-threonylcarbamoyladenylate synthase
METKILTKKQVNIGAKAIKDGKLVVFPTETVYGLGGNAFNNDALFGIYRAKGRPSDNPLILHVSNFNMVEMIAKDISEDAKKLMNNFWPGPLTIVLKKRDIVSDIVTGGLSTVAIRMPSNEIALELIDLAGVPIAAPSANLSGKPSPTCFEHVKDDLSGRVDYIIEGNECTVGIESTVIDMSGEIPRILRPGIITIEQLNKVISNVIIDEYFSDVSKIPMSPGQKYKHYAPDATMYIYKGRREKVIKKIIEDANNLELKGFKVAIITFDENMDKYDILRESLGSLKDLSKSANRLFRILRTFDKLGLDYVLSESIPEEGIGYSVMNRLSKASGNNFIILEEQMKISIGSDHGGFELKTHLVNYLQTLGYEVLDVGTFSDESVDYPIFGEKVALNVVQNKAQLGIVVCGTGLGIGMAASKVKGTRVAQVSDVYSATMARAHNNANILAIGGRVLDNNIAQDIVNAFLTTEFEGGRHQKRVDLLTDIENRNFR